MTEFHAEHVHDDDAPGCEFGICRREAELEVNLPEQEAPVRLCRLHLVPVLKWGVPAPVEWPAIRFLPAAHDQRAA